MGKQLLLIQIRRPNDPMLGHEFACVGRKVSGLNAVLHSVNAYEGAVSEHVWSQYDGIILGGSGDFSVHHPLSAAFVNSLLHTLDDLAKHQVPTFGICFGHQLIGRWLGGEVVTEPARAELGTVYVNKTPFGKSCTMLSELSESFPVHSGHSDIVPVCPSGCQVMLANELVHCQGFMVDDLPMASVQFHPDMTGAEARERLLAYQEGFTDRIETDAASFAEKFKLSCDQSVSLISKFFLSIEPSFGSISPDRRGD